MSDNSSGSDENPKPMRHVGLWAITPEEIEDSLHGPRGEPLRDIIAEFERKLAEESTLPGSAG